MLSEAELRKLAQEVTGRDNPQEAIEETLRAYIELKLQDYQREILRLEQKYGVDYGTYVGKLDEELPLTWEHEQDCLAWEEAVTNLAYFEEMNQRLVAHA
jgi:hypothetical protein